MTDEDENTKDAPDDETAPFVASASEKRRKYTEYTPEIAERFCERVASGEPLRDIYTSDDMPSRRTVMSWQKERAEFRAAFADAREMKADMRLDYIHTLAEQVRRGKLDYNSGRVAIEAQKWIAARENPKKYGDRIQADHTVDAKVSIEARNEDPLNFARRLSLIYAMAELSPVTQAATLPSPDDDDKEGEV